MANFPARVHVILARESDSAIILRRGPSKSVCTIGWDRKHDTFELGQWLKGRIYERRCDLSPDGRHFIYFAMNGNWWGKAKGSWTAISRSPYLKAIGLWANGSAWYGGGLFMSNSKYWLNVFEYGHVVLSKPAELEEHTEHPFHESYGGESPGVYYIRLQRDGWELIEHAKNDANDHYHIFRKPLALGWYIVKTTHAENNVTEGQGSYYDTHRLLNPKLKVELDFPTWDWVDWDQNRERLVWVEKGILYASRLMRDGPDFVTELKDFNQMIFKAIKAPYEVVAEAQG